MNATHQGLVTKKEVDELCVEATKEINITGIYPNCCRPYLVG